MTCDRCRSKALSLVAATRGVDSVALAGGDARDQLVVVGEGVDSVGLASTLRRKVGHTEIVQVASAAEAKKDAAGAGGGQNKPPAAAAAAAPQYVWCYQYPPQQPPVSVIYEPPATGYAYGYQAPTPGNICSIM